MGVVEKVQLTRTIPETLAAPSNGIDAATVAIVAEKGGLTIVTKRSGRRNRIVGQNKRKFGKLRRQTEELAAARDRVRHTMQLEEDKGQKMVPCVVDWMYSVEEFIERVNTFLDGECQSKTKSLQGWLAKTLVNPLSKKARKLEQEVVELYAKRDFPAVSYSPQLEQMVVELYAKRDLPAVSYSSRTPILKSIMDELRNPGTNIILVHGSGGVGKTTLIKEVFRQTRDDNYFDDVVMVLDVKNYPSLERIQTEILEKLGVDIIGEEPMARRACRLIERIKGEKILVILDDVSEIIDLEAIGLHCAENCRILLTSRTTLVLSGVMGMQKDFALDVLSEEESWSLFEKIAGDVVRQDDVRSTAIQVAKECGGLPLAIVSVARALKGQSTLHVWKDALRRFDRANETDHLEQIYSALELSYNYLNDELQQFFLLCGITAARSTDSVVLGDLLKYVMGLGLFKNIDTVEEACDALHSLVSKLKDHCLLLDSYDGTRVRMHDLVRDFSAMVAFRDHHVLSVAHGAELVEWPDMAFFQKCTMIILPSCKIPRLPSVPWECPQLKMFTLRGANHDLLEIPLHFFEEMKVLKVLDLTNLCIPSLPASLQFLRNLQTLCLDQCVLADIAMLGQLRSLEVLSFFNSQFKQLPREIAELTCLRLLDLTDCSELETIPPNVISSLTRLEDLRMRNSFNHWEAEQVIGERSNASLSELKYLSQLTALDVHIPDDNMLPANIFSSNLKRYHIIIGGEWTWHNVDETVNTVKLKLTPSNDQLDLKILLKRTEVWHLDMLEGVDYIVNQFDNEDFQQLKHLHVQNSAYAGSTLKNEMDSLVQHFMIEKVTLPNLMSLALYQCGGSRFLLSSSMARSLVQLKHLQISRCGTLEDMVSTDNMSGSEQTGLVFPNLEILEVVDCARLKTLGLSAVSFEKLTTLEVIGCHELNYLTTYSVARSLIQLKRLEVKNCKRLSVIVVSNGDHGTENEICFRKMQYLELSSLPGLQGFCSAHCIVKFPVLETIIVSDCPVELKDWGLQSESNPESVITIKVEEGDEEGDDDGHDNNQDGRSSTFVTMTPERLEQAEVVQAWDIEADSSEPRLGADKERRKMYPEDASELQSTETIAPEIQISNMSNDQASETRNDFAGSSIHEDEAKDAEQKEKEEENEIQFGLSKYPLMVPQIEPNVALLQRQLYPKVGNLQEKTSNPLTVLPKATHPLTATQQRLQAAIELLRSPSSSSPQSPEAAAAKTTLLELVNRPMDEVVDMIMDLESRFHSACTILVKQQVLSAGVVQGLDALLLELNGSNQHCRTITSDLAALRDKPDQEASIANSIGSLAQICGLQEQRSHQHAERILMLRQELLLEEEAKAKVDQELEVNLKQLDPLQAQLVAIRNDVARSEALQVELISQKNKFGAIWDSIRFIMYKQLNS